MKRGDSWAKMCLGKSAYRHIDKVEKVKKKIKKERGIKLRHYLCPHCMKYHLTSKELK